MKLVADHHLALEAIDSVYIGMAANALRVVDNRETHNIACRTCSGCPGPRRPES
jgi:hypothetical protein